MRLTSWGVAGGLWATVWLSTTGCAAVVLGAGAVAGYAVSRDHVELMVERPFDQVWLAALEETKRAGLLKDVNKDTGRIEAVSQGTHITVTLEPVSETTIKVLVRARKHLLPTIEVAQRLATRLARRLG